MKTKEIITQSFVRLLDAVPFDHITTQMILDESGVSRSTFYRYFKEKYNVMTWYYQAHIEEMRDKRDFRDYRLFLIDFCKFIKENNPYFSRVIKTEGTNSFFPFLSELSMQYYESIYKNVLHQEELTEKDRYQILMISEAGSALMRQYIVTGCKEDPQEMAACLIEILPPKLRQIAQ